MAEAVGLVFGGVALASLFSQCMEFLDYLEAAKGFLTDLNLARTKVGLLETRLERWGLELHVLTPGEEHGGLRKHWSDEGRTVTSCLSSIREISGSLGRLSEKYGPQPQQSTSHIFKEPRHCSRGASRTFSTQRLCLVRKCASWAIRDKKKFDDLISQFEFFITNLEKIYERVASRETPFYDSNLLDDEPERSEKSSPLRVKMPPLSNISKVRTFADYKPESIPPAATRSFHIQPNGLGKPVESSEKASGHEIRNNISEAHARQILGDNGDFKTTPPRTHVIVDNQAKEDSVQMNGNNSLEALKLVLGPKQKDQEEKPGP